MAFAHGKSGYIKIGANNLSTYCNSIDFPATVDTAETSTFGSTSKTYVVGLIDHTLTVEGLVDPTGDQYFEAMIGAAAATFYYGPAGSTVGNKGYTGSCIMTGYNPSTPIGDAVKFTSSFQISGTVTRGTFNATATFT
jgi:hypothetical protein